MLFLGPYKSSYSEHKEKNYLTVGAVMIPMKRILPQLKGWLAWNTKICFKKNVFNSVSYRKIKKTVSSVQLA